MKVLHVTSKVIIALAEIALVVVILISVIPLAAGGIQADMVDDPTATMSPDNTVAVIDGSAYVDSQMMWDIGLSYSVMIGTADQPLASSDLVDTTVVKGETTYLPFHIEIPLMTSAMYMISTYSLEDGTVKLPAAFHINGDYIDKLIGFSVDLDFTMNVQAEMPTLITDDRAISGSGSFRSPIGIPAMNETWHLSINNDSGTAVTGDFHVEVDGAGNIVYEFNLSSNTELDLTDAITSATGDDGHLVIDLGDGSAYDLDAEQAQTFISIVGSLMRGRSG